MDNGLAKITKAFTSTRWTLFRDLKTIVKKLIKQNPEDTEIICKTIDELFLGKMTEKEFYQMFGKTDETKAYFEKREASKNGSEASESTSDDDKVEIESTTDVTVSKDNKLTVESESENDSPFDDN